MANTIRIKKRSSTGSAGAPTSLAPSELAFNENTGDLKLYYGYGDNGDGTASSIITVGGSGAFFSKTDTRAANTVLAGPGSGADANPTFRALVAADIPSILHTQISDFDSGVQANRLDELAAPTASVSLNNNKLTSVADPTNAQDAATKAYVDAVKTGLDVKDSVKVATTANITLSGTQTIDGVAVSADERVLVKNQSTGSENGIYDCKAGAWSRSSDFDSSDNVTPGAFVFVEQGTANQDQGYVLTTDGSITVGTTSLSFTQFSGAGSITAGDGIQKSGSTLSVDLKANGGLVIESAEIAVDLGASAITGTLAVGDGGTGSTTAVGARTALGLAIGTNVQAFAADLSTLSSMQTGAATALAALTSTEIAILDGATVTTAELNILDGVTATASEINVLDGITSTTAELNIVDGDTTATATTLAAADRMVINDGGTMVQVALSDLVTFLENGAVSGFDVDGGTY